MATQHGSPQPLSAARIVATAIELADETGLASMSIRKLGERLGAGTMATYRHVASREALVELMIDAALGPPPTDIVAAPTWQIGVERWAAATLARYGEHPWLIDAPVSNILANRNRALWLESILQPLSATGLPLQQLLDAALLIDGHARNTAYLRREVQRAGASSSEPPVVLPELLDPVRYPMMSQVLASGALEDDSEQELGFGLGRIIAGIEALAD
ncbi:TetR/AcrR family transcriptional regulator [soil metagenome]